MNAMWPEHSSYFAGEGTSATTLRIALVVQRLGAIPAFRNSLIEYPQGETFVTSKFAHHLGYLSYLQ